jgi:uncharacterized protein (DUF433 family)
MVGISCSKDVLWGKPRIAGTRISVDLVYNYVRDNNIEQIYTDYPDLSKKQVLNAINYIDSRVHRAKERVGPSATQA